MQTALPIAFTILLGINICDFQGEELKFERLKAMQLK